MCGVIGQKSNLGLRGETDDDDDGDDYDFAKTRRR